MAGYQETIAYDFVPELHPTRDESSEVGQKQKGDKRPFKIDYVPLARGAYTEMPLALVPTLKFGGNFFSEMLPYDDSKVLFRALLQRCHRDEQLRRHRLVFLGRDGQPIRDVKMPLGVNIDDFVASPSPDAYAPPKRWAVAIDCEMVGVAPTPQELAAKATELAASKVITDQPVRGRGPAAASTSTNGSSTAPQGPRNPPKPPFERSELAQLCAVDALTGEVLIDVLVQPRGRVVNWRTRYSGVTQQALREAKARGNCVTGWEEARSLLLGYVDASTILVGHSLDNDLPMLRLAHRKVVDTALQTAEAVYGAVDRFPRIWRLKDLLGELAGITVQNHGRQGHSCLEDTLATRELALWCLRFPRRLEAWGQDQRRLLEAQAVEREVQRVEREKAAKENEKKKAAQDAGTKAAKGKGKAVAAAKGDAVGLKHDVESGNDMAKKRPRRKPKPLYAY